jgi:hypothetical protein
MSEVKKPAPKKGNAILIVLCILVAAGVVWSCTSSSFLASIIHPGQGGSQVQTTQTQGTSVLTCITRKWTRSSFPTGHGVVSLGNNVCSGTVILNLTKEGTVYQSTFHEDPASPNVHRYVPGLGVFLWIRYSSTVGLDNFPGCRSADPVQYIGANDGPCGIPWPGGSTTSPALQLVKS